MPATVEASSVAVHTSEAGGLRYEVPEEDGAEAAARQGPRQTPAAFGIAEVGRPAVHLSSETPRGTLSKIPEEEDASRRPPQGPVTVVIGSEAASMAVHPSETDRRPWSQAPAEEEGTKSEHEHEVGDTGNELTAVVQLIATVVQSVVEAVVDVLLLMLLAFPLMLPWRFSAVLATAVPEGRPEGWRQEYRTRAFCHFAAACIDVVLLPLSLAILVVPTRVVPLIEGFMHRDEMLIEPPPHSGEPPAGGDGVPKPEEPEDNILEFDPEIIQWNEHLRVHGAVQVLLGVLDILCIPPFLLVMVHPWRAIPFLRAAKHMLSQVPPIEGAYLRPNFDPGNGRSRWTLVFEDARGCLIWHCWGVLFDWPCFLLGLASLVFPSRTIPLISEFFVLWDQPTDYIYPRMEEDVVRTMKVYDWHSLHILCVLNFFYGITDMVVLPFFFVVLFTLIRAIPLAADLWRDWPNSPMVVKVVLPPEIRGGGRAGRLRTTRAQKQSLYGSGDMSADATHSLMDDSGSMRRGLSGLLTSAGLSRPRAMSTMSEGRSRSGDLTSSMPARTASMPARSSVPTRQPSTGTFQRGLQQALQGLQTDGGARQSTASAASRIEGDADVMTFGPTNTIGDSPRGPAAPRCSVDAGAGTMAPNNSLAVPAASMAARSSAAPTAMTGSASAAVGSMVAAWGSVKAEDFPLAEELNGTYQLWGMYQNGPLYRLMVKNVNQDTVDVNAYNRTVLDIVPAQRPAFIAHWDGMWHICLTQDPSTAVIRFPAGPHTRDPTNALLALKDAHGRQRWQRRRILRRADPPAEGEEPPEEWVDEYTGTGNVPIVSENKITAPNLYEFGHMRYNKGIREHVMQHTIRLCLDIFLLPFFLVIGITGYRFPALIAMMKRDAEFRLGSELGFLSDVDVRKLSETWAGDAGYVLGGSARYEVFRQVFFIFLDILLLPVLVVLIATYYRLPYLKGKFDRFTMQWHFHLLLNLNVLLCDAVLVIPAAFVAITYYRLKYVLESRSEPEWMVSGVDFRFRMEILRQAGLVWCDLFAAPGVLLIYATTYRVKYIQGVFSPKTTDYHQAVLNSTILIFHDFVLAAVMCGVGLVSPARLCVAWRALNEDLPYWYGRGEDPQWRAREEVYRQMLLAIADIVSIPAILPCYLTRYRWRHVGRHIPSSFSLRPFSAFDEDPGLNMHIAAWWNCLIVLHDTFLLGPVCLILLVTFYRRGPVVAGATAAWEVIREEEEEAGGPEAGPADEEEGAGGPAAGGQAEGAPRPPGRRALGGGGGGQDEDGTDEEGEEGGEGAPAAAFEPAGAARRTQEQLRPWRWRRITRLMIQADPAWGDLVNWNEAPLVTDPSLRAEIWFELGSLIVDLPFLFMGLLVALTMWRLPVLLSAMRSLTRVWDRRRAAVWQLLFTIRDLFVLPLFLFMMTTPRALRLLSELCCTGSRGSNPLEDDPLMELVGVEATIPLRGQPSLRLHGRLTVAASAALPLRRRGVLRIHCAGAHAWQDAAAVLGRARVSLAKMLLPMKVHDVSTDAFDVLGRGQVLMPGDTVSFSVTFPFNATRADLAAGAAKMVPDNWVLLQFEALDAHGHSCVLAALPLQVRTLSNLAASASAGQAAIPPEELGDEERRRQILRSQRRKVAQELFAGVVAIEFKELFVDIGHVLAFFLVCLSPWRVFSMISRLHEPAERWPCHVGTGALQDMEDISLTLRELRGELLPLINSIAKEPAHYRAWCGEEGRLPKEVLTFSSDALREHRWLEHGLRQRLGDLPQVLAQKIGLWLEMQDARLYYTALRSYANCLLAASRLTIEEHGIVIQQARAAEASFARATAALHEEISATVKNMWLEAKRDDGRKARGIWNKDMKIIRRITEFSAGAALSDWGTVFMIFVTTVTVYFLPQLFVALRAARWPRPTTNKFKAIIARTCREAMEATGLFIQVCCLWVLLALTLARLAEAIQEALAAPHSLRAMRDMQARHLREGLQELWLILTCRVFIDFLQLAVRCVLQLLLVPPACLNELVTRLIGQKVRLPVRFALCFVLFYTLTLFPTFMQPALEASTNRTVFILILCFLLLCNIASVARNRSFTALPDNEWMSPTLSITWSNIASLTSVIVQPAMLIVVLIARNSLYWEKPHATCDAAMRLGLGAAATTLLWLFMVSWTFLARRRATDTGVSAKEGLVAFLQQVLSHLCFLPTVAALLGPTMGQCVADAQNHLGPLELFLLPVLAAYLLTTQLFSGGTSTLGAEGDALYTTLYSMVVQLADYVALAVPLSTTSRPFGLGIALVACLLSALWSILYEPIFRTPPCHVRHLLVLRTGCSLAAPWVIVCLYLEPSISEDTFTWMLIAGLVALAMLAAVAMMLTKARARKLRQNILDKSTLKETLAEILCQREALCVAQSKIPGWSEAECRGRWHVVLNSAVTAKTVAVNLVNFEQNILAERLSSTFLEGRDKWLAELRKAGRFPEIAACARQLHAGLRVPSALPVLRTLVRQIVGRADLVTNLVDRLVGHERLALLLQAALLATPSSNAPAPAPPPPKPTPPAQPAAAAAAAAAPTTRLVARPARPATPAGAGARAAGAATGAARPPPPPPPAGAGAPAAAAAAAAARPPPPPPPAGAPAGAPAAATAAGAATAAARTPEQREAERQARREARRRAAEAAAQQAAAGNDPEPRLRWYQRSRLANLFGDRRRGKQLNVAAHLRHARVALEDVLWHFRESSGSAKQKKELQLVWAVLHYGEGHVFEPNGSLLLKEPKALLQLGRAGHGNRGHEQVPQEPQAYIPQALQVAPLVRPRQPTVETLDPVPRRV